MSDTGTRRTMVEAELVVGGMTCGSCAARIERRLNLLDGVEATVNYATERAYFTRTGGREPGELIGVIESTGYTAPRPAPAVAGRRGLRPRGPGLVRRLGSAFHSPWRSSSFPRCPSSQFRGWQWISLLLAVPVALGRVAVVPGGLARPGHGAATMDTLVSLGVAASLGWSVYALLFGGAGSRHADAVLADGSARPGAGPSTWTRRPASPPRY